MKSFLKKALAILMCVCTVAPVAACSPNNDVDESTTTALRISAGGGGIGTAWMEEAGKRFEEKQAEHSYADGKTGVKVVVSLSNPNGLNTSRTDATMIYGIDRMNTLTGEVQRGYVVDINDIMTEKETETRNGVPISVDDKFFDEMKSWYKAEQDGHYYGVPYIENYAGLSYNRDVFDAHNLYFAKPGAGKANYSATYGKTFYTVGDDNADKSCGPDGEYGTQDDGLPSSLVEFLCLCEYMVGEGVRPINLCGGFIHYINFLQDGMIASLIGYDRYRNIVYESDSKGQPVRVVTGYTDEPLFPGIDYIKKPVIQEVVITPECGYYSTLMEEKYYVDALLEIIEKEEYFAPDANNDNASHLISQQNFMAGSLGGTYEEIGMLVEASYWNYESYKDRNYEILGKEPKDIDVRWMCLPVRLFDTVTEGNGEDPFLYEYTSSYLCINSRYENDPEHLNAAKDFLRFLMTDEELSHWTVSNCTFKPMTYSVTEEDKEKEMPFYAWMRDIRERGKVLYNWSDSKIFRNNMRGFYDRGWGDGQFGTNHQTNMLVAMRKQGYTAMSAFVNQSYDKEEWKKVLGSLGTSGDYNGIAADFGEYNKYKN